MTDIFNKGKGQEVEYFAHNDTSSQHNFTIYTCDKKLVVKVGNTVDLLLTSISACKWNYVIYEINEQGKVMEFVYFNIFH